MNMILPIRVRIISMILQQLRSYLLYSHLALTAKNRP